MCTHVDRYDMLKENEKKMQPLQITAWEESNPYEHSCDEERCVWKLLRKKGACPECEPQEARWTFLDEY